MILPFFRSSLLTIGNLCEGRLFIEYCLGRRGEASHATLVGSTVHGVMELLALAKLNHQQGNSSFKHDSFRSVRADETYDVDWMMSDDPTLVDILTMDSFKYYDNESPGIFKDGSYQECVKLVNQALAYHKGAFDPRASQIYAAELPFELTLQDEWAHYNYDGPDGPIEGQLSLKGTIDLVLEEDSTTLLCLDYKTSKGLDDWATGKKKTEMSLYNDPQMMFYYYVLAHVFPDKDILMTLYFIRLDTAFTLVFDRKKDLPRIHAWLKERYQYFSDLQSPKFIDGTEIGWKCRWCCHNTNKQPGTKQSVCKFVQRQIKSVGIDETMKAYGDYNMLHNYGSGGSSTGRS